MEVLLIKQRISREGCFYFGQGEQHLSNINSLQSLVIDEADRMIQEGHYQELSYLMDKVNNSCKEIRNNSLFNMQYYLMLLLLTCGLG